MWDDRTVRVYSEIDDGLRTETERALATGGLRFDRPDPERLVVARGSDGSLVGTGALAGSVIKQLYVAQDERGTGVLATMVTKLVEEASQLGRHHVFVFTKPESAPAIAGLGFSELSRTPSVVLLEHGLPDFDSYVASLRSGTGGGVATGKAVGSLVMNCNPFSRGHQYLVETAAAHCDLVHLFVVTEDRSLFPTSVRLELVRTGTRHLHNVVVHEGGPYIISAATFPNYFLRTPDAATTIQAELDATLFSGRIAPALGITDRFLGEEPLDPATDEYNKAILSVMPARGIEVHVIPRMNLGDRPISASTIRQAIRDDDWDAIAKLVPDTTLEYLQSERAGPVLENIRGSVSPH